ncbi:hypothetical protein R6Q59_033644 [Mikania micrantha]
MEDIANQINELRLMLTGVVQKQELQQKTNESHAKQLGQLAEQVAARDKGKLPSDTTLNPQHQPSGSINKNAQVSHVTTLRSGKSYDNKVVLPPHLVEGVVEDVNESEESGTEQEPVASESEKKMSFKEPIEKVLNSDVETSKGNDVEGYSITRVVLGQMEIAWAKLIGPRVMLSYTEVVPGCRRVFRPANHFKRFGIMEVCGPMVLDKLNGSAKIILIRLVHGSAAKSQGSANWTHGSAGNGSLCMYGS